MSGPPDPLVNIVALIDEGGQITIGQLYPIPCAAIANDDHNCLAMLRRHHGESFHDLLLRLDTAIVSAWNDGVRIDEINPPAKTISPSRRD